MVASPTTELVRRKKKTLAGHPNHVTVTVERTQAIGFYMGVTIISELLNESPPKINCITTILYLCGFIHSKRPLSRWLDIDRINISNITVMLLVTNNWIEFKIMLTELWRNMDKDQKQNHLWGCCLIHLYIIIYFSSTLEIVSLTLISNLGCKSRCGLEYYCICISILIKNCLPVLWLNRCFGNKNTETSNVIWTCIVTGIDNFYRLWGVWVKKRKWVTYSYMLHDIEPKGSSVAKTAVSWNRDNKNWINLYTHRKC